MEFTTGCYDKHQVFVFVLYKPSGTFMEADAFVIVRTYTN